jgi:hypothetical protein
MEFRKVDPVVRSRVKISRQDKVATAGSCFAQHISAALVQNGFQYYVAEEAAGLSAEEARMRHFGVFSARYGNIYTPRQLLQLFDRAYGTFTPSESFWEKKDGHFIDPFRPNIEPTGFESIQELQHSRALHFSAVRDMFENLDVFVFTLGLTEAWRNRVDGAIFPFAPGVVAGALNPTIHEFINLCLLEVVTDIQAFIDKLSQINPRARVILTVSPVPLIATFEDRHVLVSTTYSKSVLRVAAEEICRNNLQCEYFPSYEIITGNYTRGQYFEDDLRSIKAEGVDHVMRLFLYHCSVESSAHEFEQDFNSEHKYVNDTICDEEIIDT